MNRTIVIAGLSVSLLAGCGASEDPEEAVFDWKVEGDFNLNAIADTGVMYDAEPTSDPDVYQVRAYSPNGALKWQHSHTFENPAFQHYFSQQLQQGNSEPDEFVLWKKQTVAGTSVEALEVVSFDPNGNVRSDFTIPFASISDSFTPNPLAPGHILQVTETTFRLFNNGLLSEVFIPELLMAHELREVRPVSDGYFVFFTDVENGNRINTSVISLSLAGEIQWTQDFGQNIEFIDNYTASEGSFAVTIGESFPSVNCRIGVLRDQGSQFTLTEVPCVGPDNNRLPQKISASDSNIYVMSLIENQTGINTLKYNNDGTLLDSDFMTLSVYLAQVADGGLFLEAAGTLAFSYSTTEHLGLPDLYRPTRYIFTVKEYNQSLNVLQEIQISEFYQPDTASRCYFRCGPEYTDTAGYTVTGVRVLPSGTYVSLDYTDYSPDAKGVEQPKYYARLK